MSQASEQIARQYANAGVNHRNWGDVITNVKVYNATGDGVTDDTASLQAAANAITAGGTLWFPPGTYLTDGLTLTANTQVMASKGAVLKGRSGSGNVLTLASGCELYGLTINGNKTVKTGGKTIYVSGKTDIIIKDCYIYDSNDQGIDLNFTDRYVIEGCRIYNCFNQGINLTASNKGRIIGNDVNTCWQGIQWWGGDAAVTTTVGIFDITITGNIVKNVTGGIWGSLGDRITVQGNTIESCSDVGLDFEGCTNSTATGNTIKNCVAAGMSIFYGSSYITFTGNTVYQEAGNGPCFKAYGTRKSNDLIFDGNIFRNKGAIAIDASPSMLEDCLFIGNRIRVETVALQAVTMLDCNKIDFKDNKIVVNGPTGIRNEGGNEWSIIGNTIETTSDSSSVDLAGGGISLFWRSSSFPAQKNTIKDNVIKGFVTSIAEDNWGDNSSFAWISGNRCVVIASRGAAPAAYKGQVDNNFNYNTPLTAISRTVV